MTTILWIFAVIFLWPYFLFAGITGFFFALFFGALIIIGILKIVLWMIDVYERIYRPYRRASFWKKKK
jgi:hypothetical protein